MESPEKRNPFWLAVSVPFSMRPPDPRVCGDDEWGGRRGRSWRRRPSASLKTGETVIDYYQTKSKEDGINQVRSRPETFRVARECLGEWCRHFLISYKALQAAFEH
jgi:hypothetical protein